MESKAGDDVQTHFTPLHPTGYERVAACRAAPKLCHTSFDPIKRLQGVHHKPVALSYSEPRYNFETMLLHDLPGDGLGASFLFMEGVMEGRRSSE